MDRLASCYFCGTAMDDTLREYRVVPAELRDDDDDVTTATLCPSCHDKLERLLAPVVGAAGGDGATLDARRQSPEPAGGRPAEARSGTAEPDEGAAGPADGGDEPAGDEHSGGTDPDLVDVDGPLAGGTAPDEDDDKRVRITHTGGDDEATGGEGESASVGGSEGESDEEAAGGEERSEEKGGSERASGGGADAGSGEPDPARTTVSALEYNKVMRLLQNREFPVDRAEIQTIAANAYGLAESECAAVIDLAIDRGLIAEQDGQLVRPE